MFLCRGNLPLASFNASLLVFLPKGEFEGDATEVIRSEMDNRPLSLKNTDNKILAGIQVRAFRRHAIRNTNIIQRGFVPTRNFLENVVDLDSASRIFSMHFLNQCYNPCAHLPLIPILPLFDFMAAFPSVIHEWIFLCLRHRGFPIGFINFILAIYHQASAFAFINGRLQFLFPFLSGVLQGCPASAFLFNSSLDPFLNHFSEIVRTRSGILRVCADDVGAALRTLRCLRLLFPVFQCAQDLAGLTLKPVKCV